MTTLAGYSPQVRAEVKQVREVVAHLHEQLLKWNLVARVHTHSTYATAWAVTGQSIPCGLTMMGDEFEGPVPVGPFCLIGSQAIGKGVVDALRQYPHSPAVLMQNQGPFTIGGDVEDTLKAAAMTEEAAHTMWAAHQLGDVIDMSQVDIDKLNDRYKKVVWPALTGATTHKERNEHGICKPI